MCKDDFEDIHDSIRRGDLKEVGEHLKKYPPDKYFNNSSKTSAAKSALEAGNVEIYELLLSRGISLGQNEFGIFNNIDYKTKRALNVIHRNHAKTSDILKLLGFIYLSHDTPERMKQTYFEVGFGALGKLTQWIWTDAILKIVSTLNNLMIIFDFKRNSVEMMDPTRSCRTRGITKFENNYYVFIGANGLLRPATEAYNEVLGTLIHELCHVAMMAVYNNDCKPYGNDDHGTKENFEAIVQACKDNISKEEIIGCVFEYKEDLRHAELITRVPQILALYHDKIEKFVEAKETFIELFTFFKTVTLENFKHELLLLEAKEELAGNSQTLSKLQAIGISIKREVIKSIFNAEEMMKSVELFNTVIKSNWGLITLKGLFDEIKSRNLLNSFIFLDFAAFKNPKKLDLIKKVCKLSSKPKIIVDCTMSSADEVKMILFEIRDFKRILFVTEVDSQPKSVNNPQMNVKEIVHSWQDLMIESQLQLKKSIVNFQGNLVALEDVLEISNSTQFDLSTLINSFTRNRELIIKSQTVQGRDFFIERKLVDKNNKVVKINFIDSKKSSEIFQEKLQPANQLFAFNFRCHFGKVVIIKGEAGSGKTCILKAVAQNLTNGSPVEWVVFMNWKLISNICHYNVLRRPLNKDDIKKFLAERLLVLNNLEREIFSQMFDQNRVVFLMDGIDEIGQKEKQMALEFISSVMKLSRNKLWVASRSNVCNDLQLPQDSSEFDLNPFTNEEQGRFYKDIFNRQCLPPEDVKQKLSWVKRFSSMKNPLMMKILARAIANTEGLGDINLYSFYNSIISKAIRRFLASQSSEVYENLLAQKFLILEFYEKVALNLVLSPFVDANLINSCFRVIDKVEFDENESNFLGILRRENDGNFTFVDTTFADFFVAKYFGEVVSRKSSRTLNIEKSTYEVLSKLLPHLTKANTLTTFLIDYFKQCNDFHEVFEAAESGKLNETIEVSNFIKLNEFLNSRIKTDGNDEKCRGKKRKLNLSNSLKNIKQCFLMNVSILLEQSIFVSMEKLRPSFWNEFRKRPMLMQSQQSTITNRSLATSAK